MLGVVNLFIMGLLIEYLNRTKRMFTLRKWHTFKLSKGKECHYWEIYVLPTITIFSCRSNFIDKNIEMNIKWLNYVLNIQFILKRRAGV